MMPLLQACSVTKVFGRGIGRKGSPAVEDFSLTVRSEPPSITALVGESGSGKTTIARMLLGLIAPTSGEVRYEGKDLQKLNSEERRRFRRDVQIIFQDPFEVYNPFYRVDHLLTVPIKKFRLATSRGERARMMERVLIDVGLDPQEILGRYPHQLSGGQRQRLAIARALLIQPRVIIADEPVSMVDASLRVSILNSLRQLNQNFGISILYITHDLATAYQLSQNMIVLYRGSVAEAGDVEQIVGTPRHPYTRLLIDSIPRPDPDHSWGANGPTAKSTGLSQASRGCKFADRCPHVMQACRELSPPLYRPEKGVAVACYLYDSAPTVLAADIDDVLDSNLAPPASADRHPLGAQDA